MRAPRAARAGIALALAASAVALTSLAAWPVRREPAVLAALFAGLAAGGGAVCTRRRELRPLGAVLLAAALLTVARLASEEPWRALLEIGAVLVIAAGMISLRRSR
jgi:hypothetical protein